MRVEQVESGVGDAFNHVSLGWQGSPPGESKQELSPRRIPGCYGSSGRGQVAARAERICTHNTCLREP